MELSVIQNKIIMVRKQKVILDFTLAELYEVENRALKQAVKRNVDRFPRDFMFILSDQEINNLVSQNVIPSKSKLGGSLPMAFTEQGVAMLSSVLRSKKAIQVNIAIMRAFMFIRQYALSHKDLTDQLKKLETKYNKQFKDVYEAINYLLKKDKQKTIKKPKRIIGYKSS